MKTIPLLVVLQVLLISSLQSQDFEYVLSEAEHFGATFEDVLVVDDRILVGGMSDQCGVPFI